MLPAFREEFLHLEPFMLTDAYRHLAILVFVSLSLAATDSGSFADDAKANANEPTDYELMRLFVDTFQQVESNYVREVDRRKLLEAAIDGMLGHLDQYSTYIPPQEVRRFNQAIEQEFGGIGITVNMRNGRLLVVSPLPDTPAYRAGIRAGDIIVEVEGKKTDGITLNGAVRKLQGPVGRPVTVKVIHPGESSDPREITMTRQLIKAPTVRGDRYGKDGEWLYTLENEPDLGYVRLSHFSRFTVEEVKAAIDGLVESKARGVILDLRRNPGGLLESAVEIADMFLSRGNIVSVRGRNVPERSWDAKASGTYPDFPIAVLVSRYSASASEVLSACLQDNKRAVIIGERTWGKGSVQNVIQMEHGDSALKLTTASYHRPSGVNIHRFPEMNESDNWGVTPNDGYLLKYSSKEWQAWDRDRQRRDVLLRDNEKGTEGDQSTEVGFEDRQLNAAIDYLKSKLDQPKNDASSKDESG